MADQNRHGNSRDEDQERGDSGMQGSSGSQGGSSRRRQSLNLRIVRQHVRRTLG